MNEMDGYVEKLLELSSREDLEIFLNTYPPSIGDLTAWGVSVLVLLGWDVNRLRDSDFNPPLNCTSDFLVMRTLLEAGADPNLVNGLGITPLDAVIHDFKVDSFRERLIILFRSYGAKIREELNLEEKNV